MHFEGGVASIRMAPLGAGTENSLAIQVDLTKLSADRHAGQAATERWPMDDASLAEPGIESSAAGPHANR